MFANDLSRLLSVPNTTEFNSTVKFCAVRARLLISSLVAAIYSAEAALRWAKARTASATTANPLPCSPGRAASTAAFKAKRLVWKAISSITEMISYIFLDNREISVIEVINVLISFSPVSAASVEDGDKLLPGLLSCSTEDETLLLAEDKSLIAEFVA